MLTFQIAGNWSWVNNPASKPLKTKNVSETYSVFNFVSENINIHAWSIALSNGTLI